MFVNKIKNIRTPLVVLAMFITLSSLIYSNYLIRDLKSEEYKKMEIWAEAMRSFNGSDEHIDLSLVLKVLNTNTTIPVIVLDKAGNVQAYRNLDERLTNPVSIKKFAHDFALVNRQIRIYLKGESHNDYIDVVYDDSKVLKQLAIYPYIQITVVLIFVIIAIFSLLNMKSSEQNRVWAGLSKETAHQLGTPISSLMAWVSLLQSTYPDDQLIPEINKDVSRLQLIADRFSKIGSIPDLSPSSLYILMDNVINYIQLRSSKKVQFVKKYRDDSSLLKLNPQLFEWVIEVILKNAIDAIQGKGLISIEIVRSSKSTYIDITDTGKGIIKSKYKTIFAPGFTTKSRGWGLGLSLAKRIIEDYHHGSIFVKRSEINVGTTFRIVLKNS